MMDPPSSMTYRRVVIRDSVYTAFLVADLNELGIQAGCIQNSYLNATTKEKLYLCAGDK